MVRLKVYANRMGNGDEARFQFLMVRLKAAPAVASKATIPGISIPYGAIKSMGDNMFKKLREIFQFLMVRLKASCLEL